MIPAARDLSIAVGASAIVDAIAQYSKAVTLNQCSLAARAISVLVVSNAARKIPSIDIIQPSVAADLGGAN